VEEQLECCCEDHNIYDMYAVAVMKPGTGVVGHLPRRISTPCNRFIQNHGAITCIVTGSCRDLEQGGLEIPAKLIFEGGEEMMDQVRSLIQNAPSEPIFRSTLPELIPKNQRLGSTMLLQLSKFLQKAVPQHVLTMKLRSNVKLSCQLKFPSPYLMPQMKDVLLKQTGLQIIHSCACHWVTAFKKKYSSDVVVYDSMFDSIDDVVKTVVTNIRIWNFQNNNFSYAKAVSWW